MSDPARFCPIVYDPTIGELASVWRHIPRRAVCTSRRPRRGKVKDILKNWPQKGRSIICVTDGGRILGLGDLGANGAGIPSASCSCTPLRRACHRNTCCPCISMPVQQRAVPADPLYLGMRKPRPSTNELFSFVDEFVEAVQEVFPEMLHSFRGLDGADAVHTAPTLPRQVLRL